MLPYVLLLLIIIRQRPLLSSIRVYSSLRPCGHPLQDGAHITFQCPLHRRPRDFLLKGRSSWEDLDLPLYIQEEGDEDAYEATEEFFSYLYTAFH